MRRRSHCTSASNWDSKAWKFSRTERKSYVCAFWYVPCRILLQQFETTQICRTRNYVSTSAENGPAMAGPAGPVPAPMFLNMLIPIEFQGNVTSPPTVLIMLYNGFTRR